MAGMTGRFVQLVARGDQFDIVSDPSVDLSLNPLLQRLFPLIRAHISVAQYIEEASALDRGLVSHALCAALRNLLKACGRPVGDAARMCVLVNSSLRRLCGGGSLPRIRSTWCWWRSWRRSSTRAPSRSSGCGSTCSRAWRPCKRMATVAAPRPGLRGSLSLRPGCSRRAACASPCRLHQLVRELSVEIKPAAPADGRMTEPILIMSERLGRPAPAAAAAPAGPEKLRGGALLTVLWNRMHALSGYARLAALGCSALAEPLTIL